jgi:hypothetical protein
MVQLWRQENYLGRIKSRPSITKEKLTQKKVGLGEQEGKVFLLNGISDQLSSVFALVRVWIFSFIF